MGACCRMEVPARTGASPRVRQLALITIASSPPFDPPNGYGCELFARRMNSVYSRFRNKMEG
eukprot:4974500-Pyramimonas_sp.AAC.1